MLCIANVYAKKENGSYKLFNALPITTKNWRIKTVGSITYHYSPDYKFNTTNAERMNAFADSLQKLYSLKPVKADFYIGKNLDELMKLDGLEFFMHLVWSGKAERLFFDVDTVSPHIHERNDPRSIIGWYPFDKKGEISE